MRTFIYRITFILVGSGTLILALGPLLSSAVVTSPFAIVQVLGDPLSNDILRYLPRLPPFAISLLRWLMLLLVFHRFYCIVRERRFAAPSVFKTIWAGIAVIGIVSFFVAVLGLVSLSSWYPWPSLYPLSNSAFSVAQNTLPLVFISVELFSIFIKSKKLAKAND